MTKQERIFDAIGGADALLLARSERTARHDARRWGAWGAAACLALFLLLWGTQPKAPVIEPDASATEPDTPNIDMNLWNEGPRIHLLSFQSPLEEQVQFYLYIDEETYGGSWQEDVFVISPKKTKFLENLPPCVMEISHLDVSPEQAAETVRADLEGRYASVTETEDITDEFAWKAPVNTLRYFEARDGLTWDDAQRESFLVDDGQGGVFLISYGYFMEATEGHGSIFAGMAATFHAVPAGDAPAWMTELDETVEKLIRGVFSGEVEDTLLLPGAEVEQYDPGAADDAVIRRIDKAVNNETVPTAAMVTIPYTLGLEEPGGTLEMQLIYQEGRWLAWRITLEK